MKDLGKILRYVIPYWVDAVFNVLFNLLSVIFSLFSISMVIPFLGILFGTQPTVESAPPLDFSMASIRDNFFKFLSDIIAQHGEATALLYVSLFVVASTLFKTGFRYLAMFKLAPIRNNVVRDIRNKLFNKSIDLPLSYYSEERKGDIISRMTNDVKEIEWSVLSSLEVLFRDPITIIIYVGALLYMSPQLTLLAFILLPFSGYLIGKLGRTLRKTSKKAQHEIGFLLSLIDEALSGLRIVKAFNAEEKVQHKFNNRNEYYTTTMVRIFRRRYLANPMSEFMGTIVVVAAMWYGGSLVLDGDTRMNSESLIAYLMIFSQVIPPAKAFSTAYYNIQKGLASADRVDEVMQAENPIKEKPNAKSIEQFNNSIKYKDVWFRYNAEFVLEEINLSIEKGKTVALVGQSGSGKSTLVDLLPRFYDTAKGDIQIDGISLRDMQIKNLRSLMGTVSQESILFNDSIFNNIAFGMDDASKENVIKAAKVANAHEFIMSTEDGYQTNIGDRGSKLSGGQRQRLSIARAILKNPPILILDEATSALDTESEKLVQDALNKLMENRTSIVIAHRLSTVKDADEICVLHQGKIVERGRHEELLELNGYYKKYHDVQMFS